MTQKKDTKLTEEQKVLKMKYDSQPKTGFVLFTNKSKKKEGHSDRRGHITLTGEVLAHIRDLRKDTVELELAGWDKVSKAGEDYIRGAVNIKRPDNGQKPVNHPKPEHGRDIDIEF
jgi:hypothetical protein